MSPAAAFHASSSETAEGRESALAGLGLGSLPAAWKISDAGHLCIGKSHVGGQGSGTVRGLELVRARVGNGDYQPFPAGRIALDPPPFRDYDLADQTLAGRDKGVPIVVRELPLRLLVESARVFRRNPLRAELDAEDTAGRGRIAVRVASTPEPTGSDLIATVNCHSSFSLS